MTDRTLYFQPIRGGAVSVLLSAETARVRVSTEDGDEAILRRLDFEPDGRSEALAECRNILADLAQSADDGASAADLIRDWSQTPNDALLVEMGMDADDEGVE